MRGSACVTMTCPAPQAAGAQGGNCDWSVGTIDGSVAE